MAADLLAPTDQPPAAQAAPAAPDSPTPASATPADNAKRIYPSPADQPTQLGPNGIRFDFNLGARVVLPARSEGRWRVRLRDLDTGNALFQAENQGALVTSSKRYYVRFGVDVWELDGQGKANQVFSHTYDARDRDVLVQFPVGTLGDSLGWLPYAAKFQECHSCRLTCCLSPALIPLFRDAYPHIGFITQEEVRPERFYATYSIGLFFDDADNIWQPCDFRHVGLHRTAGYILGVDPTEVPPRIALADDSRPIEEPYVCIATQSTSQCKKWNNRMAGARSSAS